MSIHFSKDKTAYHPPLPEFTSVDIALVLGGGGARGVAHVAVLEALLQAGIKPDLIVGCSVGALVGALYADSLDIDYVKTIVLGTKLNNMLDISYITFPLGNSKGHRLKHYISQRVTARDFAALKMPFVAVATNLQFGDRTAFASGPLVPALRASSAIPGVFFPIKISGQYFVDGVVSDPVPVTTARKFHPKIIIAVDIGEELSEQRPSHMFNLMKRSLDISYMHLSTMVAKNGDVIIKFPFRDIGTFNDGMNDYIYNESRKATLLKLDEIRALVRNKIPNFVFKKP